MAADLPPVLVADSGGTNARFGLVSAEQEVLHTRVLPIADYASIEAALDAYLGDLGGLPRPRRGALAIASAITGDAVAMTNYGWHFSVSALRQRLGFERLEVINDFTAVALAVPHLKDGDRRQVGGGAPVPEMPIGVLGPGSGLGASGVVPVGGRWVALTGEGGHATIAAASDRESAVIGYLRGQFDHVSAERLLSGPGLVNLYHALAALDGTKARDYGAANITDPETAAADPLAREATTLFCSLLGTFAGNLALTLGARGGIYIAGGIVPRLGPRFNDSPFRERFESKGRLRPYLAAIPSYVITHPLVAFIGCAARLHD